MAGATAVQLARANRLAVIGTAGTERGRKLVLPEGAHHVLDHTAPGYLDECVRLSEPRPRANVEEQVLRHDTEIEP
jgi:NADPH:quinone reductase